MKAEMALRTCALLVCLATLALGAEDWPCLRGPRHDGVHRETGWKKDFQEKPPMLWQFQAGEGYSSFACAGGRVYTGGTRDGQQTVVCLDAANGKAVWEKPFEREYRDGTGNGPRATPTVDGDRVYMVGALGSMVCLKAATGDVLWSKQLGPKPQWGHSGSVLIEGNLAIVAAGAAEGAVIAYDKVSGNQVWAAGRERASYGTPYPFTLDGTRYVFAFVSRNFLVIEAKTGKVALTMQWATGSDVNAAFPVFHNGYLYFSTNYGMGAALFKLSRDGDRLRHEEVWRNNQIQNRFSSMVLHEGKLYGMSENALLCADFMTGRIEWSQQVRREWGNAILADGHVIFYSPAGNLLIAPATAAGFQPSTRVKAQAGRCWTAPVLHQGRLYVRNQTTVECLSLTP